MNRQEVFNKVAIHLLTQKARCMDEACHCLYLNDQGQKCAIGILIPDGHEAQKLEGDVYELLEEYPDIKELLGVEKDSDQDFLVRLQQIHDKQDSVQTWKHDLRDFAESHNLDSSVIDQFDNDEVL